MTTWTWPLYEGPRIWPDAPGQFGAIRKHDIHTGVDLYTYPGMPVRPVETGVVVAIENFTGLSAGSPWWNETQAVLVEGASGVLLYGELTPLIQLGALVTPDSCLGGVKQVLKKDKGRPMHMLHLELYAPGTRESVIWDLDQPQPEHLFDPSDKLRQSWLRERVLKWTHLNSEEAAE